MIQMNWKVITIVESSLFGIVQIMILLVFQTNATNMYLFHSLVQLGKVPSMLLYIVLFLVPTMAAPKKMVLAAFSLSPLKWMLTCNDLHHVIVFIVNNILCGGCHSHWLLSMMWKGVVGQQWQWVLDIKCIGDGWWPWFISIVDVERMMSFVDSKYLFFYFLENTEEFHYLWIFCLFKSSRVCCQLVKW